MVFRRCATVPYCRASRSHLPGGLTTTGPCSFSKELSIPPHGLCLFYTVLAACRPKAWQAQSQDHSGFFCSGKVEHHFALAAKELRKKLIVLNRGELASAAHLLRGGHPGHEELGQISEVFGCSVLVTPEPSEAFPVICGQGPVGLEVCHSFTEDGAGHQSGHYRFRRSWLAPGWETRLNLIPEACLALDLCLPQPYKDFLQSPCATTSAWYGWRALAESAMVLLGVCQKKSSVGRRKTRKKTRKDAAETAKMPNKNETNKRSGVRKGQASLGHSRLVSAVLVFSFAGCCDAVVLPQTLQSRQGPPFGNVSGWVRGCSHLDALNYLCPWGAPPGVDKSLALTSHGNAELQLLAADSSMVARVTGLAERLRWRAGFPASNCDAAALCAILAFAATGVDVGWLCCFETQFVQQSHFLAGWLGIRVGEARRPGPRGNQTAKRKADEAEWSADQQDSQLAQTLLNVLQTFQQGKQEVRQGGNPHKKGKGGPAPKTTGSRLAHILLQILQVALTQGWSDDTVAQRLIAKIIRPGPQGASTEDSPKHDATAPENSKQALGEQLYPKVFALTPELAGKVTGMFLEWPPTEVQRLLQSERFLKTKVQEALTCLKKSQSQPAKQKAGSPSLSPTVHDSWADKARAGLGSQNGKAKGKGKSSSQAATPRFAIKVNPAEWNGNPVVATLPKVQQAFSDGLDLPGNLIVTRDAEVVTEAFSLFNAFGCQGQKLTVPVLGSQAAGPSVCVWWSQSKKLNIAAQRFQLKLTQIDAAPGPALKPAVVTSIPTPLDDKYGNKFPPLVLLLSQKHYVGVRPPPGTSVPRRWLTKTAIPSAASLRGVARSSSSSARTPSVRTVQLSRSVRGLKAPSLPSASSVAAPSVHTWGRVRSSGSAGSLATPSVFTHRVDCPSRVRLRAKTSLCTAFSQCACAMSSVAPPSEVPVSASARSGHFNIQCSGERTRPLAAQGALWQRLNLTQRTALAAAWGTSLDKAELWHHGGQAASSKVSHHSADDTWQRDLCSEGVEPNPGPKMCAGLTLNCGSSDSTWALATMCPSTMQLQDWQAARQDAWGQDSDEIPVEGCKNPDAEWARFNRKLQNMFSKVAAAPHPGRLQEANRQFQAQGHCDPTLLRNINKSWPRQLPWSTWADALEHVHQELQKLKETSFQARIKVWKEQMCEQGKAATRWLNKDVLQVMPEILTHDGVATATTEESFSELSKFWSTMWKRQSDIPQLHVLQQQLAEEQWRTAFPDQDWIPTWTEFTDAARRARGSSAGCDGWTGTALSVMPAEAFTTFLILVRRWRSQNVWPSAWTHLRQVHLRKVPGLGPVKSKDLRPIAVMSVWYRALMITVSRRPSTQQWLLQVAPDACHGGLAGRSITTAVGGLLPALEAGQTAIALDYKKCFDMLRPDLVLAHLTLHRWPPSLISLLRHTWPGQKRWMELGHLSCAEHVQVDSSMPQGDPLSPLGLIVSLAEATQAVSSTGIRQSVFLDDRVLVAPTVRQAQQGQRLWKHWSSQLGLVENDDKVVVLAQDAFQRHARCRAGVPSDRLQSQLRLLGVDFVSKCCSSDMGAANQERFEKFIGIANRLSRAPVPIKVRSALYRTRVIPKASFGWWWSPFPVKAKNSLFAIYKKIGYVQKMCSRDVRLLLEGHILCPEFQALSALIREFRKATSFGMPLAGSWLERITSSLTDMGWQRSSPTTWEHEHVGAFHLINDPKDRVLHQVREGREAAAMMAAPVDAAAAAPAAAD
eukprot:Skav208849  [mRNA]  locus=scaffold1839:65559:76580:+ [translate_table: standard]